MTTIKTGTLVKTIASQYGTPSYITRVNGTKLNSLGTLLYIMDNGQTLSRNEFKTR